MIVLEGIDKSGKTTLANYFATQGYKIIKCSAPTGDPYREYAEKILNADDNTVFDRLLWGEMVYGKIKRGGSLLDDNKFNNLELLLKARNATLIYCSADVNFLKAKFKSENETFTLENEIELVLTGYQGVRRVSILSVVEHRIPTNKIYHLELKITPEVIKMSRYVGDLNPEIVFVGEVNNENVYKINGYQDISLPFDFGRSSELIKSTIKTLGLKSYGLTNLIKFWNNNSTMIFDELEVLKPRKIVALGELVYKRLSKKFDNVVKVWHPSYARRFHYHNLDDYVNGVKNVIT